MSKEVENALYPQRAGEEIRRLNRLLDVLDQVNQAIVHSRVGEELLSVVCRLVVEHGAIQLAWIGWLDPDTAQISPVAHSGNPGEILRLAKFYADDRPEGMGNPGKAIREGRPFVCNECGNSGCLYPAALAPVRFGFRSCGSFPLRVEGVVCGTLNLCVAEAGFFREREIHVLENVAVAISFALDRIGGDTQRERLNEELQRQSAFLRSVMDAMPYPVFYKDNQLRYLGCNKAFERFLGDRREQFIGQTVYDVWPRDLADVYHRSDQELLVRTGLQICEGVMQAADGVRYDVVCHKATFRNPDGRVGGIIGAVEDITERKRAEERAARLSRIYQTLSDTNEALVRITDENCLFQYICDITCKLDDFPLVWIGMHEAERNVLVAKAAAGELAETVQEIELPLDPDTPAGRALVSEAFRRGAVLVSNDYRADSERVYWHGQPSTVGVASALGLPLRRRGEVVGILGISSQEVGYFDDEIVHLFEGMTLDISFGLDSLTRVKELRESEERYHKLFEEATEGICLVDAETGEILDVNLALSQLTGYARHELIGKSQVLLHPREEGDPRFSRTFAQHRGEKSGAVLPAELLTRSGAIKQVEIKANVLEIGCRKAVQGFFRDVTDESRYHRERETTLKLLRLLNDLNDTRELIRNLTGFLQEWTGCEAVGVRLRDGDDFPYFETRGFPPEFVEAENYLCMRDRKGQLVRDSQGNPVLECMCGHILSERSNPAMPFFTPRGSFWTNSTTELLAGITEAERPARMRGRCNTQGYESIVLVALRYRGHTLGLLQVNDRSRNRFTPELITFLENISDQIAMALAQRQVQAALRVSEQRFRDISEAAGEFVWEVDLRGRFTYVSERVDFLEYRPEELIGRFPGDFMVAADGKRTKALIARAVQTEEGFRDFEHCFIAKSGRWVWATATGVPIVSSEGELLGFRGATLDITGRKEAEERLKAQSERLREANAALKVLLNQREQDRIELEESLLDNVKLLILPYLEKLKRSRLREDQRLYLEILESHLKEVATPFVRKLSTQFLGLTPTEIRVSDLVRQGRTSKEIAEILGTSERAVLFHRQSIRGKLGLKQRKVNLQSYLATIG